jgi:hypothetical protein
VFKSGPSPPTLAILPSTRQPTSRSRTHSQESTIAMPIDTKLPEGIDEFDVIVAGGMDGEGSEESQLLTLSRWKRGLCCGRQTCSSGSQSFSAPD